MRPICNLFVRSSLAASLALILDCQVMAQTFTNLYNFTVPSGPQNTNRDGTGPSPSVISSNRLYGTASKGGTSGNGTLFRLNTDGSGFSNLHNFRAISAPFFTNDGLFPGSLILSGNTLYGAAHEGGGAGRGALFAINTDGSGFTNFYTFADDTNGVYPNAILASGNTLYGTASGGSSRNGTVFRININGSGFVNLHHFAPLYYNPLVGDYTNSDGLFPLGLILSGDTLYGITYTGGGSGRGTLFRLNTDGSGFTNLHSFNALDRMSGTNDDGANPSGDLVSSDNFLYGTAMNGGSGGHGTVFKISNNGSGFAVLHGFSPTYFNPIVQNFTNSDGGSPFAGLVLSGNTLYGTAAYDGSLGRGTVFAVNTDGSDFLTLHSFAGRDGIYPSTPLLLLGETLYGTASQVGLSGNAGNATVFSISLRSTSPIISCPEPLVLDCGNGTALGTVQAEVQDTNRYRVQVVWTVDGTVSQTNSIPPGGATSKSNVSFTASFGLGEHVVMVSASNGHSDPATCSTRVIVQDVTPPQTLRVVATPNVLWPPNHRMTQVSLSVDAIDTCDPSPMVQITSVTSNEPQNPFDPDWQITGAQSLDLRAERFGKGQGRTYTIEVQCKDISGNVSTTPVVVRVPHN